MSTNSTTTLWRLLTLLTCALIIEVIGEVLANYPGYLPPNFDLGFLRGREGHFFGPYQWAFYAHIVTGPWTLVCGMVLLSERFRRRFTKWHRRLGRIQAVCVLLVAVSGAWMAKYAEAGPVAGVGFAVLSVATAVTVSCGWRAAVQRRFTVHRRWMWRCYVLLCAAVTLRVFGGLATVAAFPEWTFPLAAWLCWLAPLGIYELMRIKRSVAGRANQVILSEPG